MLGFLVVGLFVHAVYCFAMACFSFVNVAIMAAGVPLVIAMEFEARNDIRRWKAYVEETEREAIAAIRDERNG